MTVLVDPSVDTAVSVDGVVGVSLAGLPTSTMGGVEGDGSPAGCSPEPGAGVG